MREHKMWTLKEIKGKLYLYTWEYDAARTKEKRKEMEEAMEEQLRTQPDAVTITLKDLNTKASRYKWVSNGQWNLAKPSKNLRQFLANHPDKILAIQEEVDKRTARKYNQPVTS